MRSLFSLRTLIGLGAVLVFAVVSFGLFVVTKGGSGDVVDATHDIELIAVVSGVEADEGWSTSGGKTTGNAWVALDDGRTVSIPQGTLGDVECAEFSVPQSCVMLADTLGSAVVWFTLVPADSSRGGRYLTLPGLVDMREGGDFGVLGNGWVIRLATPTERNCENDPGNLRDFIDSFGGDRSTSVLDLIDDQIVEVTCS